MNIGELIAYLKVDESELDAGVDRGEERMRRMGGVAAGAGAAAGAALGAGLSTAMAGAIELDSANARLQAQMGLTAEQAGQAGQLAGQLYSNGMGDSIQTVNAAIQGVAQNMGVALDSVDMQPLANQALILSDAFGIDVVESTRAAGNMMRNTGMDGQAAFDAIAGITQTYGARSEDLLDTLEEYPVQFQKLGLTGEQTFGILDQALAGNARNTDIAADALKEFSIRSVDGSAAAAKSFEALGLNAEEMTATFARGGPEAAAALDTVFDRLRATEGQAGAAEIAFGLFGTQSEDLGRALYTIDPSEAAGDIQDMAGTLEGVGAVMADTAESKIVTLQRGFETWSNSMIATEGPLGMVAAGVSTFGPAALSMIGSLGMIGMAFGPLLLRAAVFTGQMLLTAGSTVLSWATMAASSIASAAVMAASWIMAMGPIGWVIAAVVGLVALIVANWDTVVAWTSAAWGAVTQWISDAWNKIVGFVTGGGAAVSGAVTGAWNTVTGWTSQAWASICAFVSDAWNKIVGFVRGGVENAKSTIAWFASLPLLFGQWFAGAVAAGTAKIGELLGFLGGIPGRILGLLGGLGSLLINSGRSLVDGFLSGIRAAWDRVVSFVRQGVQWVRNLFPFSPAKTGPFSGSGYVTHSGKALTSDFASSLRQGMPGVVAAARSVMDGTHAALTGDLDAAPMRGAALPGDAWLSRDAAAGSVRHGDRVVQVTVNNPVAERASDTLGRRARTLAVLGPFGGDAR